MLSSVDHFNPYFYGLSELDGDDAVSATHINNGLVGVIAALFCRWPLHDSFVKRRFMGEDL